MALPARLSRNDLIDCLWLAKEHDDGTSLGELARWGMAHRRGENWLDDPLVLSNHPHEPSLAAVATA